METIKTIAAVAVITASLGATAATGFETNFDLDRNGVVTMFEYENKQMLDVVQVVIMNNLIADELEAKHIKQEALDEVNDNTKNLNKATRKYDKLSERTMIANGRRLIAEVELEVAIEDLLGL